MSPRPPTRVYLTVDTECREERLAGGQRLPAAGYDLRVWGRLANQPEELGVDRIMRELEACGLRGTFFVDPFGADSFGEGALASVCQALRSRGHDVQLHAHPRQRQAFWLSRGEEPVSDRMSGYSLAEQADLLRAGVERLVACGVPRGELCAFRAGHYAASNDTWLALREVGLVLDSSYNASYLDGACALAWPREESGLFRPVEGVWELPITNFTQPLGGLRHLQITAVSLAELQQVLLQASDLGLAEVTIVTHSFELLYLDSVAGRLGRPNRVNLARLRGLCRFLEARRDRFQVETVGELARRLRAGEEHPEACPPVRLRSGLLPLPRRLLEQARKRVEARLPQLEALLGTRSY